MPRIEFVLSRLSLTATRDDIRTVAYALGEWLVARDEPALSASYDRLRELRGAAPPESDARASFDALTTMLEGYFASAESVRRIERLVREVEREVVWRRVMVALASEPSNQEQLRASVERSKSTLSVACDDLRQRELIELVPNPSRRENVHALTRLGRQVLAKLSPDELSRPVAREPKGPAVSTTATTSPQAQPAPANGERARRPSAPPPTAPRSKVAET